MKKFLDEDFLLDNDTAKELFSHAGKMPIIDYHCHLNPREIALDRRYDNISQVWLGADHYKWRVMRSNGVPEKTANDIFDEMSGFASYAFNKSHAAAYAHVAYQTAYLKCHFYKEYMAALMTSVMDSQYKLSDYIAECGKRGIKILCPDINKSEAGFSADKDGIRFALLAVRNLGKTAIDNIIAERVKNGSFTSLSDF